MNKKTALHSRLMLLSPLDNYENEGPSITNSGLQFINRQLKLTVPLLVRRIICKAVIP